MMKKTLLPMGRIIKAHGIRGEVRMSFHADSPRILDGERYLAPPADSPHVSGAAFSPRKVRTASVRADHACLLVRFEGVTDRNEAEKLRGLDVLVPEDALPPLDKGEAYWHQLPGLSVHIRSENGEDTEFGVLRSVGAPAGQELWTIVPHERKPDGTEKEILFPAVPEFVLEIDLDAGRVVISPPPGLLELYD